jgi:hypothetical protein
MHRFPRFSAFRRHAVWLLAIGLFAMALQTLGGAGLRTLRPVGGGFQAEICTSRGLVKATPALPAGTNSLPASDHQDCCRLCVFSAPLLLADAVPSVAPAPAFSGAFLASSLPWPTVIARWSELPRGPPPA